MRFFTFLLATLYAFAAQAQTKHCYTAEVHNQLIQEHPELLKVQDQLEQFTQHYIAQRAQNRTMEAPVYVIPLVFHIIHNYGVEDIADDQVIDAVRILNLDYRKLNSDTGAIVSSYKSIAADCDIQFRLANVDPAGNCTNGIERIASSSTYNADDNAKLDPWPHDKYLNVWVVNSLSDDAASAYSYYPGQYPSPLVDGVIIINSYVGSIGTSSDLTSRVLTHEIGHCLNLKHPWGDSNSPGVACGDDGVDDTPITKGWSECDLTGLSCENTIDNVQNYMEYSFCSNMFTQGQKARMFAALNSTTAGRINLWSSGNLAATGTTGTAPAVCAPKADFIVNSTFICSGVSVQYKDLSWNGKPTSWSWSFPGGNPATSNDSTPIVIYNSPSANPYNVTLTVSNAGGTATVTKLSVITVSGTATAGIPYFENFESSSSFPGSDGFVINADDRTPAWIRTTSVGYSGTSSIMVNNFSGSLAGQVDAYITPSFNLAHVTQPMLTFKVANAQRSSTSSDMLKVYVSLDCGATWVARYIKSGATLSTSGIVGSYYVPSSSQWRTETINLAVYTGRPNVRLKFENTSNAGNNIYVDDINITGVVGLNEENLSALNYNIYPNPVKAKATVAFDLQKESSVNLSVRNLMGQTINTLINNKFNAGLHNVDIKTADLATGIYFVDLVIDGSRLVKKLIVE